MSRPRSLWIAVCVGVFGCLAGCGSAAEPPPGPTFSDGRIEASPGFVVGFSGTQCDLGLGLKGNSTVFVEGLEVEGVPSRVTSELQFVGPTGAGTVGMLRLDVGPGVSSGLYDISLVPTAPGKVVDPGWVRLLVPPVDVAPTPSVETVAVGWYHVLALLSDGSVIAWGRNQHAQLGDRTRTDRPSWVPVPLPGRAIDVAAGMDHSLALLEDGSVWSWGLGASGQLGHAGDGTTPAYVVTVGGAPLLDVREIAAGNAHSLARTRFGEVFFWGDAHASSLREDQLVARRVQIGGAHPEFVADAIRIAAGGSESFLLRADGSVWADAGPRRFPLSPELPEVRVRFERVHDPVLDVALGEAVRLLLDADGRVWEGDLSNQFTPVEGLPPIRRIAAGRGQHMALDDDGRVWIWGNNGDGSFVEGPEVVAGLPPVQGIAAGGWSWLVQLRDCPLLYAWGANDYGQLGDGSETWRSRPVQVDGVGEGEDLAGCSVTLTIFQPREGGTITYAPAGDFECGSGTCSPAFPVGTVATLTAVPDRDFEVERWLGDGSGNGLSVDIVMDGAKNVGLTFRRRTAVPNLPPSVDITSVDSADSAFITVDYTVQDLNRDRVDVLFEYSDDGGASWRPATAGPGSEPTTDLEADGRTYTFVWFAEVDQAFSGQEVVLRATPTDHLGLGGGSDEETITIP